MFKRTKTWQRSAIAIAAGSLALALGSMNVAHAQSNTVGSVFGTVKPEAGLTVVVEGVGTGFKRTVTPDANGKFSASALPTGSYTASLLKDGKVISTSPVFNVLIGQGSEVAFSAANSQVVEITGRVLRLDVSSANNGVTFTSKQLESLPIAHNLNAIIQLAPDTTRADPRYSGGVSMGGGAPSENSYYINGFPTTNALNQLGSTELPVGAIQNAQILTGGFGAEFGRSIGGVVNVTTKSGTNEWEGGINASITPSGLTAKYKDILYPNTGAAQNASTDGTLYLRRSDRKKSAYSLGADIGGPIIKDKLFLFAAVERLTENDEYQGLNTSSASYDPTTHFAKGGWFNDHNTNDRYLLKFNWNITQSNLLEATFLGDNYKTSEKLSGYNYVTGVHDSNVVQQTDYTNVPNSTTGVGGDAQILKFTSYLTDNLTLSALYGQSQSKHKNTYSGVDVSSDIRQVSASTAARYPGFTYTNPYPFAVGTTVLPPGAEDDVKASRLDLEWALGQHTLGAGIDNVKLKSKNAGLSYAGNGELVYARTSSASLTRFNSSVIAANGALSAVDPNDGKTYYYYGYEQIFSDVTAAESNQSAFYLQDKWQLTKDLLVTPGLRVEKYENISGAGQSFLKVDTLVHPRFSFAWDALGDKSLKVYGSAGRYGVQIPTHIAVRGASPSTYTRQVFVYTGIDPATGAPIGRVNLTPSDNLYSPDNEFGQPKDPRTVAAQHLKPNAQDEFTLGLDKTLTEKLNAGVRFTYRKLDNTIDDYCDPRAVTKYAIDHGITDGSGNPFTLDGSNFANFNCASINPGRTNTLAVDYKGNGTYTPVTLSAADMGFDSAKRTYFALDFFLEHPFSDGWYGKVTYTYSKSQGNTEGQTLSDVAQTDVAATQTWDHPELMVGANGYQPNDRRHQIKAYGFVRVLPEVDLGGNLLIASGRPKNCDGNYAGAPFFGESLDTFNNNISYGSSYHYCSVLDSSGNVQTDANGNAISVYSPRGTYGTLPWDIRFDANVQYNPSWAKGLSFRADVFNVFNKQTSQAVDEVHEADGDATSISPTFGRTFSYTAPRSVKLSIAYNVKF